MPDTPENDFVKVSTASNGEQSAKIMVDGKEVSVNFQQSKNRIDFSGNEMGNYASINVNSPDEALYAVHWKDVEITAGLRNATQHDYDGAHSAKVSQIIDDVIMEAFADGKFTKEEAQKLINTANMVSGTIAEGFTSDEIAKIETVAGTNKDTSQSVGPHKPKPGRQQG